MDQFSKEEWPKSSTLTFGKENDPNSINTFFFFFIFYAKDIFRGECEREWSSGDLIIKNKSYEKRKEKGKVKYAISSINQKN